MKEIMYTRYKINLEIEELGQNEKNEKRKQRPSWIKRSMRTNRSLSTDGSVREVPYQNWDFTLDNAMQSSLFGENYLLAGMGALKSTVFKVRMKEWRIMVCDEIGLKSLLDIDNVKKEEEEVVFNKRMLNGKLPSAYEEDETLSTKRNKEFIIEFIKETREVIPVRFLFKIIEMEFVKIKAIHFENNSDAEKYDFEGLIERMLINVVFRVFLDEYALSDEDSDMIMEWRKKCFSSTVLDSFLVLIGRSNDEDLCNNMFELIRCTDRMTQLRKKIHLFGLDYEELLNEVVYFIFIVAIDTLKGSITSSLLRYLRLPLKDLRLIQEDADVIFKSSNESLNAIFPTLKNIDGFYKEVNRLHPQIPKYYCRAKKDFVLKSLSGNFQIYEDDLLCGYPFIAKRDPTMFDRPEQIIINRSESLEDSGDEDTSVFGNTFDHSLKPLSDLISKVFIVLFTKCTVTPVKVPVSNKCNFETLGSTYGLLKVKHFHYER